MRLHVAFVLATALGTACAASVTKLPEDSTSDDGSGGSGTTTTSTGHGGSAPDGGLGGHASGGAGGATTTSTTVPATCATAADCAALNDACNEGACVNATCTKKPTADGTGCDDGQFCTDNDVCQAGACVGGSPKYCPSKDTCHLGVCDEATKACKDAPANDGAACQGADPCFAGVCSAGTCAQGAPIDCSAFDGPCAVGTCDKAKGCYAAPKNDGASCGQQTLGDVPVCDKGLCVTKPANAGAKCDDGLYCTIDDKCTKGVCQGAPNPCAAPGDVCMIGTCDEATHTCVAVPGNDGKACDDKNLCTTGETCAAGKCQGGKPANAGAKCDDGNACTLGTSCDANGVCGNANGNVVNCVDNDGCCPAGCAIGQDNDCSLTKWSEGTQAWPDEACNPVNSFGGCNTNAQDAADAWATWVCQKNGFSKGVWTGNKAPGCNGDISMWCNDKIPCDPIFENACAPGDQTKVELTCFK
jgi:hypothetical protein